MYVTEADHHDWQWFKPSSVKAEDLPECTIFYDECFTDAGAPFTRATDLFKHIAFQNPQCGDCGAFSSVLEDTSSLTSSQSSKHWWEPAAGLGWRPSCHRHIAPCLSPRNLMKSRTCRWKSDGRMATSVCARPCVNRASAHGR